jgi:hypothetical protein
MDGFTLLRAAGAWRRNHRRGSCPVPCSVLGVQFPISVDHPMNTDDFSSGLSLVQKFTIHRADTSRTRVDVTWSVYRAPLTPNKGPRLEPILSKRLKIGVCLLLAAQALLAIPQNWSWWNATLQSKNTSRLI